MNFTRAFSYAFEDRDWTAKLLFTLAVTVGAALLTPLLVGFVLWAALLSYLADIVRNVHVGVPQPLPDWGDLGRRIGRGGNILVAFLVYMIPNLLLGCCTWFLSTSMGSSITGSTVALGIACCILPLTILYSVFAWPMLALGIARFAEQGRTAVFFDFGTHFRLIQSHADATIQFLLTVLLVDIVLGLLALIPCAGWLAAPALAVPVHGYVIGQYAARVLGRPRQKPAPQPQRHPYRR